MRNAAVAGLIAGIVWGIAGSFFAIGFLNVGLPYWTVEPPPATHLMEIFLPQIIFSTIFGIVFGIIFSKIYNLIPGKTHVLKGLVFGLGLYFLIQIRMVLFFYSYEYYPSAIGTLLNVTPIIYGLILGILYKEPIQELETKHDMKDGLIPGILTGLIFGVVIIIIFVTSAYLGFVLAFMEKYPDYLTDIGFIIDQYGAHTVLNMFLMACYGAIYVRFYDRIPGKALIKGAIFGFIIWLIVDLTWVVYALTYGMIASALQLGLTIPDVYIAVGILIEGFYKKRWKAFPIAAAIFLFAIAKSVLLTPWLG